MCLILFALQAHPRYSLIVAANRDETYERPSAPAAFWTDHPHVFGGRDLTHGGTWLALARDGRFAAITNYRQIPRAAEAPRSRGALTRDYLTGTQPIREYLESVADSHALYRGFSLIAGTIDELYFCSNRGEGIAPITRGVHGLSNHLLDEPWPKVLRGVARLKALCHANEAELEHGLFDLLAHREPAPDHLLRPTGVGRERERDLSSSFISSDRYGTRASTVVLVGRDGEVLFCERSFGPHGVAGGTVRNRFTLTTEPAGVRSSEARG
jgi:uncharacterized protein with NRDE domain